MDWLTGTRGFNAIDRILYFEICWSIWYEGKPIRRILLPAVMQGISEDQVWHAYEKLLRLGKIYEDGEVVWNQRARDEHEKAVRLSQKRSHQNRLNALSGWKKRRRNGHKNGAAE